jgi:hypothetical protein
MTMNFQIRNVSTQNELDINTALFKKFQTIDQATLMQRAIDYLTSIGATQRVADLAAIETGLTEFYQDRYDLLITDFSYGEVKQSLKSLIAHQETYANASPDDPLEATFSYEYSRQDGQSFKFTEGLKVGAKAGVKAKLPLVGEANVEVSAEVSFSAEQSFSTTESSKWNFLQKVTVKPLTSVKVIGYIRIGKIDAPFNCNVKVLDGNVLVEVKLKGDKGYSSWVFPVAAMMSDAERSFVLSGNLSGSEASDIYVKVEPVTTALL